ncbi:uncharacterized protein LOC112348214 [Selaginella moellendorffii]|uniref:uncharacterized protein LOC112348214 n=1 Tax=Selaginella moellendorffii TaxID=88036 RepID=UPI000D1CC9AD|nr:uncharacterized protein LOC112348214 [Selaginella moellendorffii]|eukprot:XP_024536116.1 uncharacterized protein LOC112348214 [Selaginella moellendorffii]
MPPPIQKSEGLRGATFSTPKPLWWGPRGGRSHGFTDHSHRSVANKLGAEAVTRLGSKRRGIEITHQGKSPEERAHQSNQPDQRDKEDLAPSSNASPTRTHARPGRLQPRPPPHHALLAGIHHRRTTSRAGNTALPSALPASAPRGRGNGPPARGHTPPATPARAARPTPSRGSRRVSAGSRHPGRGHIPPARCPGDRPSPCRSGGTGSPVTRALGPGSTSLRPGSRPPPRGCRPSRSLARGTRGSRSRGRGPGLTRRGRGSRWTRRRPTASPGGGR